MNENIARYTESRESTDRQRSSVKGRSGSSSHGNVSHSHESVDRQDTTRQHSTPLVTTPSGARTVLSDNPVLAEFLLDCHPVTQHVCRRVVF